MYLHGIWYRLIRGGGGGVLGMTLDSPLSEYGGHYEMQENMYFKF